MDRSNPNEKIEVINILTIPQNIKNFRQRSRINIVSTLHLTSIRSRSPRLSITSSSTLPMLQHSRARQSSLFEQSLPSIQLWNGSRMKSASIGFWEWKWDSKRTSLQIRGQTHNKENYYLCLTFPLQVY